MKKYESKKTPGTFASLIEKTETGAKLMLEDGSTIDVGLATLKRWWRCVGEVEAPNEVFEMGSPIEEPELIAEPQPCAYDQETDTFDNKVKQMLGFVIWVGQKNGIDVVPEGRFAIVNGKKKLFVFPDAISIKESKAKEIGVAYTLKHYCHQFKAKIDITVNGSGKDADVIAEALK